MAESIVRDWMLDFERAHGQPAEIAAFAAQHEADAEIAEAIYSIFNMQQQQQHSAPQQQETLLHAICTQLLAFYRCSEEVLRKFPLQFIPVLMYTYLHAVAAGDKKSARSIETLLICIYNTEVSCEDGSQRIVSFRMPILAQASVYHEEKNLPMLDLRRWEENCNREVKWGPHVQIEAITAQQRLRIMTALLFCYNQQLCQTQKSSLIHLCRVASQLVNQGFNKQNVLSHRMSYGSDSSTSSLQNKTSAPRIPLSAAFLLELLHAIYFAMFNGFGTVAIQTLEDIHQRACFEMYTELILVTSAVRNSLHANPSGQPSDGPMGLSVALTPATTTVTTAVSKSMITNASFRTKKLPDDIPIQVQDLTMQQLPQQLASVTEEAEQQSNQKSETTTTRNSIIRPSMEGIKAQAHKALIAGFKKSKDKDKANAAMEPPKPPIRKFDKHSQRNSLLQLQSEGTLLAAAAAAEAAKIKNYESLDTLEMLPLPLSTTSEANGSATYSLDGSVGVEVNGVTSANLINSNSAAAASNSNSLASSDLLTKSFDSSIELPPAVTATGKLHDVSMD